MQIGKASIRFEEPPIIESMASIVGKKEGQGLWENCSMW